MASHTAMAQGSNPEMRNALERKVGIIYFASNKPMGWSGQTRTRYTDFQVNELTKDGKVVHLKDYAKSAQELGMGQKNTVKPPQVDQSPQIEKPDSVATEENQASKTQDPPLIKEVADSDRDLLAELVGQEHATQLIEFYAKIQQDPKASPKAHGEVDIPSRADKSWRSRLHMEIRRMFDGKIESSTASDDCIKATAARGANNSRGNRAQNAGPRNNNRRTPGQAAKAPYLHFSLYKENKDTMDALNHMARILRMHPKAFGAAGTKDRRAVTVQRISVKDRTPESLVSINQRINQVKIGDFKYEQQPIKLNDHDGNEFVIVLKNCVFTGADGLAMEDKLKAAKSIVDEAMEKLVQNGFINYYGTQRFGTHRIGTHEIGMNILKGDFAGAVHALLAYDPELVERAQSQSGNTESVNQEDSKRAQACEAFLERADAKSALSHLPPRCHVEKTLIQHLDRNAGDYVGALTSINRSMRTMYGHAYQSFVWNFVASRRMERFGSTVIKGDIVLAKPESEASSGSDSVREEEAVAAWVDDLSPANFGLVAHAVTEEEVQDGKYSIYDVVLPSPGWDVMYPQNEIGEYYKEFMGCPENGGLDPHNMARRQRDFSLPGSYRKLMGKPKGLPTASVQAYTHDHDQLVPTDLDLIHAKRDEKVKKVEEQAARTEKWEQNVAQNFQAFVAQKFSKQNKEATNTEVQTSTDAMDHAEPADRDAWVKTTVDGNSNKRIKLVRDAADVGGDTASNAGNTVQSDWAAFASETARDQAEPRSTVIKDTWIQTAVDDNNQRVIVTEHSRTIEVPMVDASLDAKPTSPKPSSSNEPEGQVAMETDEAEDAQAASPQKLAVILRFALDTSQYATVVLREIQGDYQWRQEADELTAA